jgi:hypothetical protein
VRVGMCVGMGMARVGAWAGGMRWVRGQVLHAGGQP